jgi:hypothetical protein
MKINTSKFTNFPAEEGALRHKIVNRFIHLPLIIFHAFFIVAECVEGEKR